MGEMGVNKSCKNSRIIHKNKVKFFIKNFIITITKIVIIQALFKIKFF
jgi:hypothetical protein